MREVILATNPTVEGEATAHFLGELATKRGIKASRIAHGIPIGGELEYVDGGTLAHALAGDSRSRDAARVGPQLARACGAAQHRGSPGARASQHPRARALRRLSALRPARLNQLLV